MYEIRRRTPGNYSSLLQGADNAAMMQSLIVPGNRGYMKRYTWNTLQPAPGVFNFASIVADLAFCAANKMQLVAMIVDKSFSGNASVVPKGMEAYEAPNTANGKTALRWQAPVVMAINALTKALGASFDGNPNFEGVAFVETSTSMSAQVMAAHGYTPELYRDAYIAMLTAAALNLPHCQVFWNQNFFPSNQTYIAAIATAVKQYGVSVGGPDILPTNAQLVTTVYPLYAQLAGRMNLFGQMSAPGYSQQNADGSYMTMAQMLAYARDTLFMDYIFWMPVAEPAPGKGFGWKDAVPVIAANPLLNF